MRSPASQCFCSSKQMGQGRSMLVSLDLHNYITMLLLIGLSDLQALSLPFCQCLFPSRMSWQLLARLPCNFVLGRYVFGEPMNFCISSLLPDFSSSQSITDIRQKALFPWNLLWMFMENESSLLPNLPFVLHFFSCNSFSKIFKGTQHTSCDNLISQGHHPYTNILTCTYHFI